MIGGYPTIQINDRLFTVTHPSVIDGHWHNIEIIFNYIQLNITVDYIYQSYFIIDQTTITSMSMINKIYTGLAPSTDHPSEFLGCIKVFEYYY